MLLAFSRIATQATLNQAVLQVLAFFGTSSSLQRMTRGQRRRFPIIYPIYHCSGSDEVDQVPHFFFLFLLVSKSSAGLNKHKRERKDISIRAFELNLSSDQVEVLNEKEKGSANCWGNRGEL